MVASGRLTFRAFVASLSLVCLAALGPAPARAAGSPASPAFAIIDVQKILRESTAVRQLSQQIQKSRDDYQAELKGKEQELRTADQELSRQRTILTAEVFAQKRKDLEARVASLQRDVQERKRNLDQTFASGMSQVQAVLAQIAKEIAEERGLDLILSKATVVIVKPAFEVTGEALKRLNERLPTVKVALPAPN
jgi:outer membrane protein